MNPGQEFFIDRHDGKVRLTVGRSEDFDAIVLAADEKKIGLLMYCVRKSKLRRETKNRIILELSEFQAAIDDELRHQERGIDAEENVLPAGWFPYLILAMTFLAFVILLILFLFSSGDWKQ